MPHTWLTLQVYPPVEAVRACLTAVRARGTPGAGPRMHNGPALTVPGRSLLLNGADAGELLGWDALCFLGFESPAVQHALLLLPYVRLIHPQPRVHRSSDEDGGHRTDDDSDEEGQ
jgi:hypothetical protein